MGNKDVISNVPSFNEGILIRSNETIHKGFEPINHDFGDDLVNNITKANKPKIRNLIRKRNLGNEGYEGLIKRFKERP